MSCVLDDGGDDAEAQGGRVDHQEVVLGLHLRHDLGLAVTLPLTQNVGTMTRRCLVRILFFEVTHLLIQLYKYYISPVIVLAPINSYSYILLKQLFVQQVSQQVKASKLKNFFEV